MPILIYNLSWMSFNILLAFMAVLFGFIFIMTKNKVFRIISGTLWLLFLPNTIYLFTDLIHLIYQYPRVIGFEKVVLLFQHFLLQIVGFITFILAFVPFEKILAWFTIRKKQKIFAIILFNVLIAYGIVLGRVERINSWEVFTEIGSVFESMINVLTQPKLLGLTLLFGLFCNFFYFLFRDLIIDMMLRLRKNITK